MSNAVAKKKLQNPATPFYGLVVSAGLISIIGLIMVFSASSIYSLDTKGSSVAIFIRQLVFLIISIPMAIFLSRLSLERWKLLARFGLVISIFLLLIVRVPGIGKSVNGNQNWISLKVVDVQPSELANFMGFSVVSIST
jgi:cell division protein FtsW